MKSILTVLLLLFHVSNSQASDELARRILDLRSQVESQARELEEVRRKRATSLDPIHQRIAELDQGIRKERLKKIQLEEKLKTLNVSKASTLSNSEHKDLLEWAQTLEVKIGQGIPITLEDRKAKIAQLKIRIENKREHPFTLVSELWQLTEKEMKMAATNEYRTQEIQIEGKTVVAELARMGSIQAIFTLPSGESGYGFRDKGNWNWKLATNSQKESLERVMGNFRQRKFSGLYELPTIWKGN